MQLECGGNGRAAFNPPASGNQWTVGAVGNPEWTGVRYADILKAAGVKSSAVYTGHYGMDAASLRRPGEDADLARCADRQGDGPAFDSSPSR